jgi:hypothetical protein
MNLAAIFEFGLAATKVESSAQLASDALALYDAYNQLKAGTLTVANVKAAEIQLLIPAVARTITVVADVLAKDPSQAQNLQKIMNSL